MTAIAETIDATLDANGQLRLAHPPKLPPGPVQVTICAVRATRKGRGIADVAREIATEQRARGYVGRSEAELRSEEEARLEEDAERERELDAARGAAPLGGP